MKEYTIEEIATATRKVYEDIEKELRGEKKLKLMLELLKKGELSKKENYETRVIALLSFGFSLKLTDVDFLKKQGYLAKEK